MPKLMLDDKGFVYITVWIQPRSESIYEYIDCKIDTGANRTTIDLKALKTLGYDEDWIKTNGKLLLGEECPSVATGEAIDDCYSICLPEIRIGKYTGKNWHFIVSLNKRIQFRYLFGTDSMQFFNWTFDFENNFCEYNVIEGKERILYNKQNQSVSALDNNSR
jgi:hypothetical protein